MKAEEAHGGIHMPDQSWYPLITSIGLFIGTYNFVQLKTPVVVFGNLIAPSHLPFALAGGVILFLGAYLWSLEGPGGYHIHLDAQGNETISRH